MNIVPSNTWQLIQVLNQVWSEKLHNHIVYKNKTGHDKRKNINFIHNKSENNISSIKK